MEALFLKLVNMSITASYLVIAVLILRLLLRKAPRYIHVILWGIVALRLMLPFSIESVLSLIPSAEPLPQEFLYAATPQVQTGIPAVNNSLNPIIAETLTPEGLTSANPTQIWSFIFSRLWVMGMAIMALYGAVSYWLIRRKVAASIPVGKNLRLCDSIDTPFILGIVKPKIYLPSSVDQQTADHVLAHEMAHLQRRDHWWKPLGFALLTVYWFNPVLWVAYILLCRDIEMACDEKVVQKLNPAQKKAYSTALLSCSVPRRMIAACPLAFGEVGVKNRIKSVLNYKKPAFWIVVVAIIICIVVALCFLTDPTEKESPHSITASLSVSAIDRVQATLWTEPKQHIDLTDDQIANLVEILNQIPPEDFQHSYGVDHSITLMILCEEMAIGLQSDGEKVWFLLESETADKVGKNWAVVNEDLNGFIAGILNPSATRLALGDYVTADLIYWPSYSSWYWESVPEYYYQVTEEGFYSAHEDESFDVDWGWQTITENAEDLLWYFQWYDTMSEIGLEGIPPLDEDSRYQKIDTTHHLFLIGGEVYLAEGYNTRVDLTNVQAIYRLEPYTETTVSYPDSANANQTSMLYSTISGQIYDIREGRDMLIRNAIMTNRRVYKTDGILYAESHQIHSEIIGDSVRDGDPVGLHLVDVTSVLMRASLEDNGEITTDYAIITARISYESYSDGTLKLTEYHEKALDDPTQYNLTPLLQQCYDQAVKYWGLDTNLMVDRLLNTITSSPAQYSNAAPYIEAHPDEYEKLLGLGEYTLTYCFRKFILGDSAGIRGEIMAAACRDIGKSLGEDIDFDGQYVNSATWFDVFQAEARKLYETYTMDALASSYRASWVLLNTLAKTPEALSIQTGSDIVLPYTLEELESMSQQTEP